MTTQTRVAGGLAAPLLHWLVLVSGLALLATADIIDPDATVGTWIGAIAGTVVGQGFAWLRLRAWAAAVIAMFLVIVGAMSMLSHSSRPGDLLAAFVPAAACGYLSLTSRGTLAAFWFPAVPWSLAIIDAESSSSARLMGSEALWVALGALLVAALWARETRRIAQWRTHALGSLAEPGSRALLRESPLRGAARGMWLVAVGGSTIALGACIAPELWQWDRRPDEARRARYAGEALLPSTRAQDDTGKWVTCCPEAPPAPEPVRHVREYLEPRRKEVAPVQYTATASCVACNGGVPLRSYAHESRYDAPTSAGAEVGDVGTRVPSDVAAAPSGTSGEEPRVAARATEAPPPKAPEAPAKTPPAAHTPPSRPPAATTATPPPTTYDPFAASTNGPQPAHHAPGGPVSAAKSKPVEVDDDFSGGGLLAAMLALSVAALIANLVLRPVRRWFVLRHLRRPWWNESVGQRVSNLWQLALIGLRDAGFRSELGEAPHGLARRVGIPAVATCADVLDRARHGVRVDAADLAAMEQAAASAFLHARRRAGFLARVVSWWRTPTA